MRDDEKVVITRPSPDDAVELKQLMKTTWRAAYPSPENGVSKADIYAMTEDWDKPDAVKRLEEDIASTPANKLRLVAKIDNKIVGQGKFIKGEAENRLATLYVLPEFQGRGIGKQLASKGLEWFGKEKDIVLEVVKYNQRAVDLYESMGFEIAGDAQNEVARLPSGAIRPQYKMVKSAVRQE